MTFTMRSRTCLQNKAALRTFLFVSACAVEFPLLVDYACTKMYLRGFMLLNFGSKMFPVTYSVYLWIVVIRGISVGKKPARLTVTAV